ncbi:hypothetical protein AAG906_039994 [Vitis piasezkii]
MGKLVDTLIQRSMKGEASNLSKKLTTLTNNIICRKAMTTRCSRNNDKAEEMMDLVKRGMELNIMEEHQNGMMNGGRREGRDLMDILLEIHEDPYVKLKLIKTDIKSFFLDSNSWENPNEFIPERFLVNSCEKTVDHVMEMKGQDFRYISFGSGMRRCPGAALASMVMQMTIGRLV